MSLPNIGLAFVHPGKRKEVSNALSSSSSLWHTSWSRRSASPFCPPITHRLSFLMICKNPYVQGKLSYGCGQCLPCRLNRKRTWTHRIMLERLCHSDAAFVTLTYSSNDLPLVDSPVTTDLSATLVPKHAQDWLKRLRKSIAPTKIRFFLVGEYGDKTNRPHYHAALFGYPSCSRGRTLHRKDKFDCCPHCNLIFQTWGKGEIDVGELTTESAQYLAGYVTKKMTAKDDPRLYGRHPEFSRMSNRPGLGRDAMHDVASTILQFDLENAQADVPSALRHGTRLLPLGRYLRRYLRTLVGKDERISQEAFDEVQDKVSRMYEIAVNASVDSKNAITIKEAMVRQNKGKIQNIEARSRIFKKKGTL